MPAGELIRFQHTGAFTDGDQALEERKFQRTLRRLAAGPGVVLFDQHVVVDASGWLALRPCGSESAPCVHRCL